MAKEMNCIDPQIVCRICGDWHCLTVNDPVCFPVRRKPEIKVIEKRNAEAQKKDHLPEALTINGYVYRRETQAN